jgi:hypothetical protein
MQTSFDAGPIYPGAWVVCGVGVGVGLVERFGFWIKRDTSGWGRGKEEANDALSAKINTYLRLFLM